MEVIDNVITELKLLNYPVEEANIDLVLKSVPKYDETFIAIEDTETEYEPTGDYIHQYTVINTLTIGIFVQNPDIDVALQLARGIKTEVLTKIKSIKYEGKPVWLVSVKKDKSEEHNVGAYIVEVKYETYEGP